MAKKLEVPRLDPPGICLFCGRPELKGVACDYCGTTIPPSYGRIEYRTDKTKKDYDYNDEPI